MLPSTDHPHHFIQLVREALVENNSCKAETPFLTSSATRETIRSFDEYLRVGPRTLVYSVKNKSCIPFAFLLPGGWNQGTILDCELGVICQKTVK